VSEFSQFIELGTEMGTTLKSEAYTRASALWGKIADKEERMKVQQSFFSAAEEAFNKRPKVEEEEED